MYFMINENLECNSHDSQLIDDHNKNIAKSSLYMVISILFSKVVIITRKQCIGLVLDFLRYKTLVRATYFCIELTMILIVSRRFSNYWWFWFFA